MFILRAFFRFFIDTLQGIFVIIAFLLILYILILRPHQVIGSSMLPNLEDREYLLSYLLSVSLDSLKRGDIVVFDSPTEEDRLFIKRIIALSGDTIRVQDGKVYINGAILNESPYLSEDVWTSGSVFLKEGEDKVVPEGSLFVMGDNRGGSSDSREWGFLSKKAVIGQSIVRVLPLNRLTVFKNPFKR